MATTIGSLDLNAFSDLYSDSTQYFWFESNASATYGAGVHVTLVPDTTFISNPTGQNILMNTDGISIRNGLLPMMTLDNNSLDFNVVDTTEGTFTTTATFTATGAQIGQSDAAHSVIDANGQRFYASNGTTQLANIGYGEGQSQTGTAIAPYYTFGIRMSNNTIGNYSVAEGMYTTASGYMSHAEGGYTTASGHFSHAEGMSTIARGSHSHAEGNETTASGYFSHAEGSYTTASGSHSHSEGRYTTASGYVSHAEGDYTTASSSYSHAEGGNTTASSDFSHAEGGNTTASGYASHAEGAYTIASGIYSHSEGLYTIASGSYSHAQNEYTVATEDFQTVIGKYNSATVTGSGTTSDPYVYTDVGDYAFIIGNGTDNTTADRSNALTVDWNGNVIGQAMAGIIQMYAGSTPPTGWLICDGASYLRSDYPTLFAALGGTSSPWGLPDSTHFNVPDLRGRAPIGAGTGTGLTARAIGDTFGEETHTLIADEVPAHTHGSKTLEGTMRVVGWAGSATNAAVSGIVTVTANNAKDRTASSGSSMGAQTNKITATHTHTSFGGGGAHENMQPSAVVNFIICTGKTY